MLKKAGLLSLCTVALTAAAFAQEGAVPRGIPNFDHVFVIMMENHAYGQIIGNPNAPFVNAYAAKANLATNYFAVAHPSLTNYLETVGGSNFGVLDDNSPDWHNTSCTPNIISGTTSTETTASNICPIQGKGTDAATPAIDYSNETSGLPGVLNIDGKKSIPANPHTIGKTIADQLRAAGLTWKSYQESLPPTGADNVNNADGFFSNLTDLSAALQGEGQTQGNLVALYAVKHNPFVYFESVQSGKDPGNSLANVVSFNGNHGLFADLRNGRVPTYSFIAPNQCDDMHGRGNAGPVCEYDPNDNGTQTGLNPGLIQQGDYTVQNIVGAIHSSAVWQNNRSVIVVLWDENDYSIAPNTNQVPAIIETNFSAHGLTSSKFYDHFSLLKTIEAGLQLPCLNHACDANVSVMSDLFAGQHDGDHDRDDY